MNYKKKKLLKFIKWIVRNDFDNFDHFYCYLSKWYIVDILHVIRRLYLLETFKFRILKNLNIAAYYNYFNFFYLLQDKRW